MNDPREIEFQIEGDASDATSAVRQVSRELTQFLNNIAHAETRLRQLFTHQLPGQLKALEKHIQAVGGPLPANYNQIGRVARNFSSGGPAAQIDNALFSGVLANLRTDKALQAIRYEKEANKILEARKTIYDRIRAAMPAEADAAMLAKSYRDALKTVGDIPAEAGKARKDWLARTLAETKAFEAQVQDVKLRAAEKGFQAQQAMYDKYMRRSFSGLFGLGDAGDRDRQAQVIIDRLDAFGQRRGFNVDRSRLQSLYDDEVDRRLATQVARPAVAPKVRPVVVPPSREQRAADGIQSINDRFNYNGGAGMFGVQARVMANYASMAAILGSLTYAGGSAVKFQAQLKDVQAVSAATDIAMKSLEQTILSVGNSTKFSTEEIAEGTKLLAQAGYSVSQIQEMIKPISDLAAGAGANFADAVNITTSILSIFDMSIGRTAEVTNVLTAGLNQSKLSLEQLSLGIQYAGNFAADSGVQFEEMVAALGAMANAGIKSGSTLGTGFRALVKELEDPSKKFQENLQKVDLTVADVDIKTKGLAQVMKTLSDAGFDSAAAMGSFELRAAAAYSALSNNLNVFDDLRTNIVGTTAATDAASLQMDTFLAQWQRLANAVTEFTYVVGGPALGGLQALVGGLASLIHASTALALPLQTVGTLLASLAIAALIRWVAQLTLGMMVQTGVLTGWNGAATIGALRAGQLGVAMVGLANATRAATVAFLASPLGWMTLGIAALTTALSLNAVAQNNATQKVQEHAAAAQEANSKGSEYASRLREIDKYVEMLTARHDALSKNTHASAQAAETAASKFADWGLVIDARINQIDVLIGRMVKLRQEMAMAALEQAQIERRELEGERDALNDQTRMTGSGSFLSLRDRMFAKTDLKAVGAWDALEAINSMTSGLNPQTPDAKQILDWQRKLRIARKDLEGKSGLGAAAARGQLDDTLKELSRVAAPATRAQQLGRRIEGLDTTISQYTIGSSNEGAAINAQSQAMFTKWASELARVDSIKDPNARLKGQQDLRAQMRSEFSGLRGFVSEQVKSALEDPQARAGFEAAAKRNNTTAEIEAGRFVFRDTPNLQRMATMSGEVNPNADPKLLAERAKRLEAEADTARRAGDTTAYGRLRGEAKEARRQAELGKAMRGEDYDPDVLAGILDERDAAYDARTDRGAAGGGGGGSRGVSRTLAGEAKALERQIETAAKNLGPTPDDMLAGQKQLEELLAKWRSVREEQIRSESGDVEQRLADFESEAKEYRDKILGGNIQAAKELLASRAEEAATNFAASEGNRLRDSGGDLKKALEDVQLKFDDALKASLEASDASFSGLNTETAAQAVERRRAITRDYAQKTLTATLDVIDAFFAGDAQRQAKELDAAQLEIDRRRARVGALSNSYGSRNKSDVARAMGARAAEQIDIDESRLGVRQAELQYSAASRARDIIKSRLDSTTDEAAKAQLAEEFAAANTNVEQMALNLERAKIALGQMTDQAPTFSSVTDAISASWQVFSDQIKLNQPVLEQLADGMMGVWSSAHTGLQTFVKDVVTGTKSLEDAFRDLTLSILQSMLDMAAEMVANQVLMWILKTVGASFGGSAGSSAGASAHMGGMAHGGEVRGYAGGGEVSGNVPFRDSVLANLMPGEIVMSKSAVDMVGRKRLLAMNAMGNRRMSAIPSIGSAIPQRQPDTWNIWAVLPQHRPPPGKRDIVAVIADDIATNGQTKQLIRQVIAGAV